LYENKILDGRNRYRACQASGVVPTYESFTGDNPADYVISVNICRRHLTGKARREIIAKLLLANPTKSDRAIGRLIKADNKTVASVRAEQEATEEIPQLEKRTGVDGKARKAPTKKAKPARAEDGKAPTKKPSTEESPWKQRRDKLLLAENTINIFLLNCAASVQVANYDGPIDNRVVEACRKTADTWAALAERLEAKATKPQKPSKAKAAKEMADLLFGAIDEVMQDKAKASPPIIEHEPAAEPTSEPAATERAA
jgi:hypothetical protein